MPQARFLTTVQKLVRSSANLVCCVLAHYPATKLETIIDRELEISHESFAAQMGARLVGGEKGPDMQVWNKGWNMSEVRVPLCVEVLNVDLRPSRSISILWSLVTRPSFNHET